jgi:hypothetical protein
MKLEILSTERFLHFFHSHSCGSFVGSLLHHHSFCNPARCPMEKNWVFCYQACVPVAAATRSAVDYFATTRSRLLLNPTVAACLFFCNFLNIQQEVHMYSCYDLMILNWPITALRNILLLSGISHMPVTHLYLILYYR